MSFEHRWLLPALLLALLLVAIPPPAAAVAQEEASAEPGLAAEAERGDRRDLAGRLALGRDGCGDEGEGEEDAAGWGEETADHANLDYSYDD